jgi:hypothetical protein
MNHDVDMPVGRNDFCYSVVNRILRLHVKVDGPQIDFIVLRELFKLGKLRRVPP